MADINTNLKILITAQNQTNQAFSQMNSSLNGLKVAAIAVGAALASALSFRDIIDSTRKWGQEVDRLQDELGGTSEEMSKLNFIAQSVGLTTDEVSQTFGLLNKRIVDSADEIAKGTSVFDKFNIKLMDANGNIAIGGDALVLVKKRFQELGQGAQGTALLLDIFGRSGKSLSDFLALTDPQMKAMISDVEQFGGVLSQAQSDALEAFDRSLARLNLQFTLLKLQIGQFILPLLSALIAGVSKALGFIKQLGETIGRMLGPFKQWIDHLGGVKAIADALLAVGVALLALAALGGLIALVGWLGRLVLAALPLASIAAGIGLVALAIYNISTALQSTEDPAATISTIMGNLGVLFAGLSLILLPFAPVAALVAATLSLVASALMLVWGNIIMVKENWDKMGEALRRGDVQKILEEIPGPVGLAAQAWGRLAQAIQFALDVWNAWVNRGPDALPATPGSSGESGLGPGGGAGQGIGGGGGGSFASGGVVPGAMGQAVPIIAHAGEVVLNRQQQSGLGTTVIVNVAGSVISERELADTLSDTVLRRLFSQRQLNF
jgi:uncharacterized membrane protein YgcG